MPSLKPYYFYHKQQKCTFITNTLLAESSDSLKPAGQQAGLYFK